jgi:dihydroorotate dehydrogenase
MSQQQVHVAYETPVGSFSDWIKAAEACERADLDPVACINTVISPTDVSHETAYGTTMRFSRPIRVY